MNEPVVTRKQMIITRCYSSHDGNTFRSHQQVKHSDVHMKLFSLTLSRYLRKTFVIPCITSDLETEKKGLYSS